MEGRKSWPNLRYYPDNFLEKLKKTTKFLTQDNELPGPDLNPGPPDYEAKVFTLSTEGDSQYAESERLCVTVRLLTKHENGRNIIMGIIHRPIYISNTTLPRLDSVSIYRWNLLSWTLSPEIGISSID